MQQTLAIIGTLTLIVGALAGFLKGINYLIKESSLVANSIWELKKYGFRRHRKDGRDTLVD